MGATSATAFGVERRRPAGAARCGGTSARPSICVATSPARRRPRRRSSTTAPAPRRPARRRPCATAPRPLSFVIADRSRTISSSSERSPSQRSTQCRASVSPSLRARHRREVGQQQVEVGRRSEEARPCCRSSASPSTGRSRRPQRPTGYSSGRTPAAGTGPGPRRGWPPASGRTCVGCHPAGHCRSSSPWPVVLRSLGCCRRPRGGAPVPASGASRKKSTHVCQQVLTFLFGARIVGSTPRR